MNTFTVLFAGAMLVAVPVAAAGDQWSEEWHKAKFGRYSPAEEAHRNAALAQLDAKGEEQCELACCRRDHRAQLEQKEVNRSAWTTAYLREKTGRTRKAQPADSVPCHIAANQPAPPADAWTRAKWGRSLRPASEAPPVIMASIVCERLSCCD